jgi:hypothetical protein
MQKIRYTIETLQKFNGSLRRKLRAKSSKGGIVSPKAIEKTSFSTNETCFFRSNPKRE